MKYKSKSSFSFNLFTAICFIMAMAVLAQGGSAFAGTNVSGPISANKTWTAAESPYTVTGGIIVRSTATLTIEAGVTVNINAGVGIMIEGGLIARGTAAKKITFTATVKDPTPEKWGGILFKDSTIDAEIGTGGVYTSGSIMEHCIVEYAGANNAHALQLEGAHPYINYCTLRNNAKRAVQGASLSKKLYITNCQITSNGDWGIALPACTKVISGNTVESNGGGGIYSEGSTSYTNHYIQNNIVKKNTGNGIQAAYLTVSGNTVSENGGIGINADYATVSGNTVSQNGGIGIDADYATVSGNTVNGNAKTGIYVTNYSTATKNITTNNKEYGLWCDYSTVTENTITGNIKLGIVAGYYSSISKNNVSSNGGGVYSNYQNSITNNTITKNTAGSGAGIACDTNGYNTIINNTITENEATADNGATIYIGNSGGTKINKNRIYNNKAEYELYENTAISSSYDLDATENWWGTTDENAIMGKIYDWFDNAAKNEVNYYPFANSSGDIPTPPDAGFTYSSSDLTLTFKDTSTPSTAITKWSWNFGDSKTSTEQNPSHTYAAEGIYTISLTVTSVDGTDTESAIVSVGTATPPTLSVSPANKDVASTAGTTSFAVSNTGSGTMAWSAAVTSGTWLTITSGSSGSNAGTITCSYTANTTTSTRTATIRVTAAGATGSPVDIKVTQAAPTVQTGSLKVTLSPAEAVTAGAQWQINGGAWNNSGVTVSNITVGTHTVDFKDVTGWTKPSSQSVTIQNGATFTLTAPAYTASSGGGFVVRELPDFYLPSTKLTVTLAATPASGVSAYSVADSPPAGWTVGTTNEGGFFDSATNKVKFGPFMDNTARTLTYEVTPPAAEIDKVSFSGTASADGVDSTVGGESELSTSLNHPADNNPMDFSMSQNEVTAYGSAWKKGTAWSTPPNQIPTDYITRAGYLWKNGEKYDYSPSAGAAPLCWVKYTPKSSQRGDDFADSDVRSADERDTDVRTAVLSTAICAMATTYTPSTLFTVTITVTPSSEATSYAVEETPPKGWTVGTINNSGSFDATNNKVKYGPFFDNTARVLTYQITPPATATGSQTFAGTASFDGASVAITGVRTVSSGTVASKPTVTTGVASSIASTTAKLTGTVIPKGSAATCYFEYGLTTAYGTKTAVQNAGSGTTAFAASASLTGLTLGTTYHFRLVATNSLGTTNGLDKTFTTTSGSVTVPTVVISSATLITSNSAKLAGTVKPNGGATTYYFEFGATTTYGQKTPSFDAGSGTLAVAVSADLLGLNAGTTYHFRLVATNSAGTTTSADKTFIATAAVKPVATTELATLVTATTANLNGTVNPNGFLTTYYFQYGTTTSYGSTTRSPRSGSNRASFSVNKSITGLAKATVYHFRIVAINSAGTTYGLDKTFTTLP